MKYIPAAIAAIIAGVVFYGIGRGVGMYWADTLRATGGMVTATELIECTYIIPVVFAICAAYGAWKLTEFIDKK